MAPANMEARNLPDTSLAEQELFHATIHQVEDGDPVAGGAPNRTQRTGGPNIAAAQLADRTRWLRARYNELTAALTASQLLAKIVTVDGSGSGLDADLLDGRQAADFLKTDDTGAGNGLDADTVDGKHASELGGIPGDFKWRLSDTAPTGWLIADGSSLSKIVYADLYTASGAWMDDDPEDAARFLLPDARGQHLRVWDQGRGVDPGRALGSDQLSGVPNITGRMSDFVHTAGGSAAEAFGAIFNTNVSNSGSQLDGSNSRDRIEFDASLGAVGSDGVSGSAAAVYQNLDEVRVRNIALNLLIKY